MNARPSVDSAILRFDEVNGGDPRRITFDGGEHPLELLHAQRVSFWVRRLDPEADDVLLAASRCQHIGRWNIPRDSYPKDRAGYLRWRADLKKYHAGEAGWILTELGFPVEFVVAVQDLNLKRELGRDPRMQTLEDALCLVTLELQLDDLMVRTDPAKLVAILRKTWAKMSPVGRELALGLEYSEKARAILGEALSS